MTTGSDARAAPEARAGLQAALRGCAREAFADIEREGLGLELRELADRWLATMSKGAELRAELEHFRRGLDSFEERGRVDRSRVVAHGLRICATAEADAQPAKPTSRARAKADLGRDQRSERGRNQRARKAGSPRTGTVPGTETGKAAQVGPSGPGPSPSASAVEASVPLASGARAESPSVLRGVGPKLAERLAARGLHTLEDLVYLLPLGYMDRRRIKGLDEIEEGEDALVDGVIKGFRSGWFRRRYSAKMEVETVDAEGNPGERIEARWFHPMGGLDRITGGARIRLAGPVKTYRGRRSMVHPIILDPEDDAPGVSVRYPVVEGVGPARLTQMVHAALDRVAEDGGFEELLPAGALAEHELPSQLQALEMLHRPSQEISEADLAALAERRSTAHRRLAFDEFFFLQLALLAQRRAFVDSPCAFSEVPPAPRERVRACLPFEPTGAQWRTISEIEGDMGRATPMLRLLQGDVGSGKTVVAFASALSVIDAGGQVALMAPTEILAQQHFRTLGAWCEKAGIRIALLTGSTPRAQRTSTLSLLAAGQLDLVVGTHALLVDGVEFSRLGLVVVDEQHRFGVEQRAALRDKGRNPHLLVMTATPIPRSLALTAFGELEVSVIDELPPGREPPTTRLFTGKRGLDSARRTAARAVDEGARAFVVCPLVEASEAVEASDVEATAEAMRELLPGREGEVVVVHGRMRPRDKDQVMEDFRLGRASLLVATTVIEVGVDVPEATVMLVEHAERFGLAQLHQLRGRIGRGQGASTCLLHTASGRASDAGRRLEVLERSSDGFVVAEQDLEIRGPGELYGTRQSGVPKLRFASFSAAGLRMLEAARSAARALENGDPGLASHPKIRAELELRVARGVVLAAHAG